MDSDYRPVRRAASGEGKCVWLLLHVASGEMLSTGDYVRIFANKGDATRAGQEITARRLNPEGLTSKQVAKQARRRTEAIKRDKAFVPHQPPAPAPTPPIPGRPDNSHLPKGYAEAVTKAKPKRKAAAEPLGTSRPGRVKGSIRQMKQPNGTTGRGKVKRKPSGGRGRGG